jgi:hypothetical protein
MEALVGYRFVGTPRLVLVCSRGLTSCTVYLGLMLTSFHLPGW